MHVRLPQMTYNKKSHLSALLGTTVTSGMLLQTIRETILSGPRVVDSSIIDATRDQNWHRVRVYGVDLR